MNAQQWALQDGGTNNDEGTSIIADKNGHIYATGFFSSTATFGTTTLTSAGSYDGYLTKYDTSGNFIWAERFGGIGSDYPYVITIDTNNNIIIAGAFRNANTTTIGSIIINTNNNSDNYFVAMFDANGNVIWAKGNEGYLSFNDVAIDQQNNIDLIGTMGSPSIFGTDTIIPYYDASMGPAFNSWDIILAQYTSTGIINWAKNAGGYGTDYGNSITTDVNDNIYITGSIDSAGYFDTLLQNTVNSSYSSYDVYIAKMNSSGNFLWVNNYGGNSSSAQGEKIKFLNNKLFLAVHFTNTVILGQDTISGTFQTCVAKLDTLLNFSWATKSGGAWIQGLDVDANENIFFTGVFKDTAMFGSDTLITNYNYSTYTSKINTIGLFAWSKQGGGKYDDWSRSLCLDVNGNVYITGRFLDTASFGTNILIANPYYNYDIFIVKYSFNESPNGIVENNFQVKNNFSLFPNPFSSQTILQSDNLLLNATLTVDNCFGQTVKEIKNISGQIIILQRDNLPSGLYFIQLTQDNQVIATKKIIITD